MWAKIQLLIIEFKPDWPLFQNQEIEQFIYNTGYKLRTYHDCSHTQQYLSNSTGCPFK